jgi:hypothetical protein
MAPCYTAGGEKQYDGYIFNGSSLFEVGSNALKHAA